MALRRDAVRCPDSIPSTLAFAMSEAPYKTYMCLICGFIYDEATGLPAEGIPPGTRWEDIPPNWTCPECEARKEDFEMVEI
jgi:rubredoxin